MKTRPISILFLLLYLFKESKHGKTKASDDLALLKLYFGKYVYKEHAKFHSKILDIINKKREGILLQKLSNLPVSALTLGRYFNKPVDGSDKSSKLKEVINLLKESDIEIPIPQEIYQSAGISFPQNDYSEYNISELYAEFFRWVTEEFETVELAKEEGKNNENHIAETLVIDSGQTVELYWIYYARPSTSEKLTLLKNPIEIGGEVKTNYGLTIRGIRYKALNEKGEVRTYVGEVWKTGGNLSFNLVTKNEQQNEQQNIQFSLMPDAKESRRYIGTHISYPLDNSDKIYYGVRIMEQDMLNDDFDDATPKLYFYDSAEGVYQNSNEESLKLEPTDKTNFTAIRRNVHNQILEKTSIEKLIHDEYDEREANLRKFKGEWMSFVAQPYMSDSFDINFWDFEVGKSGTNLMVTMRHGELEATGTLELKSRPKEMSILVAHEEKKSDTFHQIYPTANRKSLVVSDPLLSDKSLNSVVLKCISVGPDHLDGFKGYREVLIKVNKSILERLKKICCKESINSIEQIHIEKLFEWNPEHAQLIIEYLTPPAANILFQNSHNNFSIRNKFKERLKKELRELPKKLYLLRRKENNLSKGRLNISSNWRVEMEHKERESHEPVKYVGEIINCGGRHIQILLFERKSNSNGSYFPDIDQNSSLLFSINLSTKRSLHSGITIISEQQYLSTRGHNTLFTDNEELMELIESSKFGKIDSISRYLNFHQSNYQVSYGYKNNDSQKKELGVYRNILISKWKRAGSEDSPEHLRIVPLDFSSEKMSQEINEFFNGVSQVIPYYLITNK